jgi:hypothetical protein
MKNYDIPRPEYPRPQFVRDKWLNLNGTWEFLMDPENTGMERNLFQARQFQGICVQSHPYQPRGFYAQCSRDDGNRTPGLQPSLHHRMDA